MWGHRLAVPPERAGGRDLDVVLGDGADYPPDSAQGKLRDEIGVGGIAKADVHLVAPAADDDRAEINPQHAQALVPQALRDGPAVTAKAEHDDVVARGGQTGELPLEEILWQVAPRDEELLHDGEGLPRLVADGVGAGWNGAPADERVGASCDLRLDDLLALPALLFVAREENDTHPIVTGGRQDEAFLQAFLGQQPIDEPMTPYRPLTGKSLGYHQDLKMGLRPCGHIVHMALVDHLQMARPKGFEDLCFDGLLNGHVRASGYEHLSTV